jgi:OmpR-family two-component system manganese-sensing sensor histidine kinase
MFQTTRRRLALWYTAVTAVLLLLFASGFYVYVRSTLVERVDDTLNHVVEVVERSLVIEPDDPPMFQGDRSLHVNVEASFRSNTDTVEDDHIDLEWFSANGELLWSTFPTALNLPVHLNPNGETVRLPNQEVLRQVTQRVQIGRQVLGYLRVSHPWFEVTKPTRQLIIDLGLWTALMVGAVAAMGWFLSGLAIAPIRDSYQRLKQFTADASHELRNPIAVIQTNVQVALADPDPQWQRQQLQVVERLTRRLGRLVDNLLFLARQDSNMSQPQVKAVDLEELLLEVLEEQQTIALEKSLYLDLHVDFNPTDPASLNGNDAPLVMGDRDQLMRLFTNLVSNAVRYTPSGGQVEIRLRQRLKAAMPWLEVQVVDTGMGIPTEAIPRLFDRFYRVDPARSHASKSLEPGGNGASGSGLGLAIAKVIVDNHHGQIQIDSTVDKGTQVTVSLPRQGMGSD